jgi:23S rRNA (uracil1939-C5)-methyltransferase
VDFVIDSKSGEQRIGLFDREHAEILDLKQCPQLSPALEAWYQEFREIQWPIERGSVRLRVSPSGERGAWLDFANLDVKNLLEERDLLQRLMSLAFVEIGQRRKALVLRDGQLKLIDPILKPWFETYVNGKAVPLLCTVGSFTQPGFRANHALLESLMKMLGETEAQRVFEFGSGIGNFTLPIAQLAEKVTAFEIDILACGSLEQSLQTQAQLQDKIEIRQGDFQKPSERRPLDFSQADSVFVDPPRSGLKDFLKPLEQSTHRPLNFFYVSCFAESFSQDAKRLQALGYELKQLKILDQFPQSPHFEIISHFAYSEAR